MERSSLKKREGNSQYDPWKICEILKNIWWGKVSYKAFRGRKYWMVVESLWYSR